MTGNRPRHMASPRAHGARVPKGTRRIRATRVPTARVADIRWAMDGWAALHDLDVLTALASVAVVLGLAAFLATY